MHFPMTRAQWQHNRALYQSCYSPGDMPTCLQNESEAIHLAIDWLLVRLYRPDVEIGCVLDRDAVRHIDPQILDEPINWGDLSADVERAEDGWTVTLEEAADGHCPALCAYIKSWLERWGWKPVMIQTTW